MEYKRLIDNIDKAANSSEDVAQAAENLAKIDIPEPDDFTTNVSVLAEYVSEFQFDWDNEATDEEEFAFKSITIIKQILGDIKSGNQYKRIFSAELAYSSLEGDDYTYKVVVEKMLAQTIGEAIKEKDDIRTKAPQQHPGYKSYFLEDVRVKVKVIDQSKNTILGEKFVLD